MRKATVTCRGCGADIRYDDEKCPYCGHPHVQHERHQMRDPIEENDVYAVDRDSGSVRFGDGVHGRRPSSGRDNIRAAYRSGGGSTGVAGPSKSSESARIVRCSACGTENELGLKFCMNCNARL